MHKALNGVAATSLAAFAFGAIASSASANVVGPGGNGVAWTAPNVSSPGHRFVVTNPSTGGSLIVTCKATLANVHGAGDAVASFTPTYSNCSVPFAGNTCKVDVAVSGGQWSWTQGSGGSTTWAGTVSTGATTTTIAFDDIDGCGLVPSDCTISVPGQSGLAGSSGTNQTGGVKFTGTISGITWTALPGCAVGAGASNGSYALPAAGVTFTGVALN